MCAEQAFSGAGTSPRRIVGIGASAGGLRALESFFKATPADTGCAFIVIQHLSPDFKSLMDDLLGRHTEMPIYRVEENMSVEANAVYLIPPRKFMTIVGGHLYLQDREKFKGLEFPINVFFRSLAEDRKERAVGVILSGTGSDGSEGVRSIAEKGGLVVSQDPDTADFDGMPKNAIGTGCCHHILKADDIPKALVAYIESRDMPPAPISARDVELNLEGSDDEMHPVIKVLFKASGVDFSLYKQTTVNRRILRRMSFLNLQSTEAYAEHLLQHNSEVDSLYRDLLIGVTEFFRDPEVFHFLEERVIPGIFKRATSGEIRLWIAGSATGEEVYSLAIAFDEYALKSDWRGRISIFATDAHRSSLNHASSGLYLEEALKNVSEERMSKYFREEQPGSYRIIPDIRQRIVFAPHNVITDPPFTRIDFVSCRNLLIYLKSDVQERVLRLFHYALNRDAILLLGTSEGLSRLENNFAKIDNRHKIFSKLAISQMPTEIGRVSDRAATDRALRAVPTERRTVNFDKDLLAAYDFVLDRHTTPGIIINDSREILHFFGDVHVFLTPETGRVQRDVLSRVDGDLKLALSTLLQRAKAHNAAVSSKSMRLLRGEEWYRVDLLVEPVTLTPRPGSFLYISFQNARPDVAEDVLDTSKSSENDEDAYNAGEAARMRIQELEQELQTIKENLQATVEELQTSNEELQATNEEMLASNEELQSTNEELHSVNEELYTVNAEFERKNADLLNLNQDHDNLLSSIDTGIVFLDIEMKIRKFNPAISSSFKILQQDIGRPLEHIAYQLEDQEGMLADVREVLRGGKVVQREVETKDGRWLLKRVLPFFGPKKEVDGAVLTFTEISSQKAVEARLQMAMHSTRLTWWEWDILSGHLETHSQDWCILGYNLTALKPEFTTWIELVHEEDRARVEATLNKCLEGKVGEWECEHRFKARDGQWRWVLNSGRIYKRDEDGRPLRMLGTTQDIHLRKEAALRQTELKERAEAANRAKDDFLAVISHELRTPLNPILGFSQMLMSDLPDGESKEWMRIVEQSACDLESLIGNILEYVQMDTEQLALTLAPLSIGPFLKETVQHFKNLKYSDDIEFRIGKGTSELLKSEDAVMTSDKRLLRNLIHQLVQNAFKFTNEGFVELDVQMLKEGSKGQFLEITVSDSGIGMSEEQQNELFTPFYQGDHGISRKYSGTGIGLTICKRILDALHGEVEVKSKVGEGTVMRVLVPLGEVETMEVPSDEATTPELESVHSFEGKRVLLVEDNQANSILTQTQLGLLKCQVDAVSNGIVALEKIDASDYDIALIDLGLPRMDGQELAEAIRQREAEKGLPRMPLVLSTAHAKIDWDTLEAEGVFDGFLLKPVQLDDLEMTLQRMFHAPPA